MNTTESAENASPLAGNADLFPAVVDRPLEAVAADINTAHREAQAYATKAVERALTAGDLLLTVKARLPHGDFGPWCAAYLPDISQRQLQKYMRVARELPTEKRTGSFLSLNEALRLVAGEAEPEPQPLTMAQRMRARITQAERLGITDDADFLMMVRAGIEFPEPGEAIRFEANGWSFQITHAPHATGYYYVWAIQGDAINYTQRGLRAAGVLVFLQDAGIAGPVTIERTDDNGDQAKTIEAWHLESIRGGARIPANWEGGL